MNEMYEMSIVTHNFGVMGMLGVILVNFWMLLRAQNIHIYTKKMRIFMPIGAMMISVILFTGTIMMAAKHLAFSVENLLMIVFGISMILFEVTRYKKLKHLDISDANHLQNYKSLAMKILQMEFFILLFLSIWMHI